MKSPWGTHRLLLARAASPELAPSILPCSLAFICRLEERQLEENEVWAFAFSPLVLLFIIIYYEAALAHQLRLISKTQEQQFLNKRDPVEKPCLITSTSQTKGLRLSTSSLPLSPVNPHQRAAPSAL